MLLEREGIFMEDAARLNNLDSSVVCGIVCCVLLLAVFIWRR